jgi:hypothetical protein
VLDRGRVRMARGALKPQDSEKIKQWLRDGYGPSIIAETLFIPEDAVRTIAQKMREAGENVRLK